MQNLLRCLNNSQHLIEDGVVCGFSEVESFLLFWFEACQHAVEDVVVSLS